MPSQPGQAPSTQGRDKIMCAQCGYSGKGSAADKYRRARSDMITAPDHDSMISHLAIMTGYVPQLESQQLDRLTDERWGRETGAMTGGKFRTHAQARHGRQARAGAFAGAFAVWASGLTALSLEIASMGPTRDLTACAGRFWSSLGAVIIFLITVLGMAALSDVLGLWDKRS